MPFNWQSPGTIVFWAAPPAPPSADVSTAETALAESSLTFGFVLHAALDPPTTAMIPNPRVFTIPSADRTGKRAIPPCLFFKFEDGRKDRPSRPVQIMPVFRTVASSVVESEATKLGLKILLMSEGESGATDATRVSVTTTDRQLFEETMKGCKTACHPYVIRHPAKQATEAKQVMRALWRVGFVNGWLSAL